MKHIKISWFNKASKDMNFDSEQWEEFGNLLTISMTEFFKNLPKQEKIVVKRIEDALKKYKDGDECWYMYIPGFSDFINKLYPIKGLKGFDCSAIHWELVVESFKKEDSEINKNKNKKIQSELNELAKKIEDNPSQLISINDITNKVEPYTNQTDEEINNDKQKEDKIDVSNFLEFMKGENKLKGGAILNEKDYKRIVKYTNYLVNEKKVPRSIEALQKINLNNEEIIYTYRRIHDHVYPNGKKRKEFFIFLDRVFLQLHQCNFDMAKDDNYLNSNCYKKFNKKPQYYDKLYFKKK